MTPVWWVGHLFTVQYVVEEVLILPGNAHKTGAALAGAQGAAGCQQRPQAVQALTFYYVLCIHAAASAALAFRAHDILCRLHALICWSTSAFLHTIATACLVSMVPSPVLHASWAAL